MPLDYPKTNIQDSNDDLNIGLLKYQLKEITSRLDSIDTKLERNLPSLADLSFRVSSLEDGRKKNLTLIYGAYGTIIAMGLKFLFDFIVRK